MVESRDFQRWRENADFQPRREHAARPEAAWVLGRRAPDEDVPRQDGGPTPEQAEAAEPGRGRAARRPGEIPARGWRDIAVRTWRSFNSDRLPAVAAGIAFYSLLSLFPALAAFVSLYGLFFDVSTVQQQLSYLDGLVPPDVLALIGTELTRIVTERSGSLSLAFVLSLVLSLWSANAASKALFGGLNVAYHEREKRNFFVLNLETLAFTLGALVFLGLGVAAIVVVPVLFRFLPLGLGAAALSLLRWPILVGLMTVGLAALYRFGPSRDAARWRWLSAGAVIAAVLWLVASLLFSWYVSNFANYTATYGSLGAVAGLMMWLWVSALVVLLGAELNSELENQTAVDTTTGAPEAMGRRGAVMADTLGEGGGKGALKAGTTVASAG